ncbi:triple functional domain protein-like [Anneissia japonica]|uniref:triple functional domain protein-like n=1 Tax=Anneissia japonica TaxID=1529436 RepID=UPI001425A2CA|nr:triple functional domain protein-like [Anneissia japonica]
MASYTHSPSNRANQKSRSLSNIRMDYNNGSSRSSSLNDVREKVPIIHATQIVDLLRRETVYISGGKTRRGGSIISIRIQNDESLHDVATCLLYLTSITSKESKQTEFTVLVDLTRSPFQHLHSILEILQKSIGQQIHRVCVVLPDAFKEGTRESLIYYKTQFNFETVLVPNVSKISKFVDKDQLTKEFGGTLLYDHQDWLQLRLDYESFLKDVSTLLQRLDRVTHEVHRQENKSMEKAMRDRQRWDDVVFNQPSVIFQHGTYIIQKLRKNRSSRSKPALQLSEYEMLMLNQVQRLLNEIEDKQGDLKGFLTEGKREHHAPMEVQELESGIKKVVDWIIGPGEKLLASQTSIGDNLQSADQLRRDHEKMELKCTETYATYAELRYVANSMIKYGGLSSESVAAQKDNMDTVCRNFASRLEKRRNLLICSVCFHRALENSTHSLEDLIETFRGDVSADTTDMVKQVLTNIDENCHAVALSIEQTEREGDRLLDLLSSPIRNAFGKDITPNCENQKSHVTTSIHEINKQKKQVNELADLWKLKLQQILQLRTCEEDAVQGIVWLEELCDVVTRSHADIGSTAIEAEQRKKDHSNLEITAERTYNYSKQLLNAGLMIRRSLGYDTVPNDSFVQRLHLAWKSFVKESEEKASRLSVSLMFNNNAERLGREIDDFSAVVRDGFNDDNFSERNLHYYRTKQDSIHKKYVDTVAMGEALLDRLAVPSSSPYRLVESHETNQNLGHDNAIINQKLVELKITKLEMDLLLAGPEEEDEILKKIKDLSTHQVPGPNMGSSSSILDSNLGHVRPTLWKDAQQTVSPYPADKFEEYDQFNRTDIPVEEPVIAKTTAEAQNTAAVPRDFRPVDSSNHEHEAMRTLKNFEAQIDESTEWVRIKVHEMTPRMTEVGQNREEALHLKAQHNKLVEQIAARQQQINALLTQGDHLVSTEQFYSDVYEAMSQSLGEAWQDLNRQLQDRRNLLDEATDFYQLSENFSDKLRRASEECKSQELDVGCEEAEAKLNNHQALKKDILATSMKTMNLGRALTQNLNELTPVSSPVEDRQATTAVCFAIESNLESLQDRRRALEDAWNKRRQDLEQNVILCKLNKEVDEVSDWFTSHGDIHLDVGDSIETTRARLADHKKLQETFTEVKTKVSNMNIEAVKVSSSTQHKLQLLLTQTRGINTLCDDFGEKLNNWHQILACTLDFRVNTQMAMETLYKLEIEIQNVNKPSEELPTYLSSLHHAVDPVVKEGQVLLSMLTYPTPGANYIQISIEKLQVEASRIENQYYSELYHETSVLTDFEEKYSVVVKWLRNVGDNYLASYNDPGDQLATAMDFLEGHEQLDDDMREKTKEVEKVLNATADIITSGVPDSTSVQERADKLRQQWTRITISVENRIRIALILVKFHKLTKELVNSMENLETMLKAVDSDGQPQSSSQGRLQERWEHMIELYVQTECKGKNYLSEANFISDDPLIVLQPSISMVEIKLKKYEEHKNKLTDMYDSWQLQQTLSKDFASQWEQFVSDAKQTIKWVEKVEADFFPISELDGGLQDTDSLQAKFDQIQLTMQVSNNAGFD